MILNFSYGPACIDELEWSLPFDYTNESISDFLGNGTHIP